MARVNKSAEKQPANGSTKLSILLAMAMFVVVVDTSLMNVSISAVVKDLNATVSGVQGAIALEALVSAAFILISSKIADLIGRKRAYMIGLLGYAIGATTMTITQSLGPVYIFWAIFGGLGASLLLPSMQALIHSNFSGAARKRTYAIVGASAAIAAGVGPLIGGLLTTLLSWRVGFFLEVVIIAVVLMNLKLIKDAPYTGPRTIDILGSIFSVIGMGGVVLGILVWQEGGDRVLALITFGLLGLVALWLWLLRRKKRGQQPLLDPDLLKLPHFRLGISQQMMQQITLGGAMIALPIYFQMTLEYSALLAGLSIAPLSLTMFFMAIYAGRKLTHKRPAQNIQLGFLLSTIGMVALLPVIPKADSSIALLLPLAIAGAGLGLLVSQLNNYTLSPISGERVTEAAGVNSAAGSFGLSFGLAVAGGIMLAVLAFSFTNLAQQSSVLSGEEKQVVAERLQSDAEVMSNSDLEALIPEQPAAVEDEILRINEEARNRSLQAAILVPVIASAIGLLNSFRMLRLPDLKPNKAAEEAALGA